MSTGGTLGNYDRALRIGTPITAVLAVVAVAVGVVSLTSDNSNKTQLDREISALRLSLSQANQQIGALTGSSNASAVSTLQSQMHSVYNCIPQLQTEVNSLSLGNSSQNGYLTNAYITNNTQISRDCNKLINGQ